ncbi:MAG: MotA/TolQ/ExbB proton channel family protein [Victivallales bacterium]|nr:MotA/TolQ/ExbB proton channel family protein [Victivallales bacterium]MBR6324635.1 MotA/TolQ/ExbB proton channel family protein [Victivallales bacterium]
MKATSIVLVLMLLFSGVSIMGQQAAPVGGAPESVVQTQPKQDEPAVEAAETTEDAEAADAESESGEEEKTGVITIEDIMVRGGWLMNVIAGLSLLAIALLFFYLLSMRQGTLYPRSFIMEAQDAAEDGDLEGLRDLCLNNGSCAAKIIGAALEQCEDGHVAEHVVLRDAMEDEGGRQAGMLWQRLQYLMDIAVIAPMVGLLGTVWGMMVSFSGLESGVSMINKADTLANGVSQAMYTTFGGLIVGIFAMAMYDLMRGRLNKLIGGMESACNSVLRRLSSSNRL